MSTNDYWNTGEKAPAKRIDHTRWSREYISAAQAAHDDDATALAQVHATLALVEQQRIANLATLSPVEQSEVSGVRDEEIIARHEDDEQPTCEAPTGCDAPAVARFVVHCACRKMRLGCAPHIESTARWFDQSARARCKTCGGVVTGYRVVPL